MPAKEQQFAEHEAALEKRSGAGRARRIMFVIEALTVGGAERMIVDLANEFSRRGDQITVVCLSSRGELADALSADVKLHVLNKKPGADLSIVKPLRALIDLEQVDVVNSHLWTANLWTRLSLIGRNVPVVVTEHNRDVWKNSHNRFIDRILSRRTQKLIAVSNDTASFYTDDVGIRNSIVCVVNNGVDTQRYSSGSGARLRTLLADGSDFLIGTVGRLTEQKNHARLVCCAALLKSRGLSFKVVIAGDGPERDRTQRCIEENNVSDCVTLLGERSDIPDLLAALDVFVLSSDREGHPLSALEAQAAGTPVVLTNAGGSADAIAESGTDTGGVLVEKSSESLADALMDLAQDESKLKSMSQFASEYALANFDRQTMINNYGEIFDAVIDPDRA